MKPNSVNIPEACDVLEREALVALAAARDVPALEAWQIAYLGRKGKVAALFAVLKNVPAKEKPAQGERLNKLKVNLEAHLSERNGAIAPQATATSDLTVPGIAPHIGQLHLVTSARREIAAIFAELGFRQIEAPEIDWDTYAFEALNMPPDHPARDEWETFFVTPNIVLTPHTSNAQVRHMLGEKPPIRMMCISRTYRRQSDATHLPMFHQFEGLVVDEGITLTQLTGTFAWFVERFFGVGTKVRFRPHHFQFTEPSFELDISCTNCIGTGTQANGERCRLCKSGWVELGGAGMVHPNVIRAGGLDPARYRGFAFGWGVERTMLMKLGVQIDDIRMLINNDLRFLEQFPI